MRKIRRQAILEAWSDKAPTTHNYSPHPLLRSLHTSLTHNLFCPFIPRDDVVLTITPNNNQTNRPLTSRHKCFNVCYFNPFGTCALAQESRHVSDMTLSPTPDNHLDYFTHEPFSRFQKRHWYLRRNNQRSLVQHVAALSQCSRLLLLLATVTLATLQIFSSRVGVGGGTRSLVLSSLLLLQPLLILWATQWRTRRFDVSLDAVVKLFMTGFFVCGTVGLGTETILHVYLNYIFKHFKDGPHLVAMSLFSFLLASLISETLKYYCVIMTRLPCPIPENEITKISKSRRAKACTTYFTCVALGFSTFENLLLTFSRAPSSSSSSVKLFALCVRLAMPIQVLSSFIVSIHVAREDIDTPSFVGIHTGVVKLKRGEKRREGELNGGENERTLCEHARSTWEKIKHSFLIHGTFNFVLIGLGYIIADRSPNFDVEVRSNYSFDSLSTLNDVGTAVVLCCGAAVMGLGFIYYAVIAKRLERRMKQKEFPLLGRNETRGRGRGDSMEEEDMEMAGRAV